MLINNDIFVCNKLVRRQSSIKHKIQYIIIRVCIHFGQLHRGRVDKNHFKAKKYFVKFRHLSAGVKT